MTWKATAKPRGCRGAGSGVPTAGERAVVGDLPQVDPPRAPDSFLSWAFFPRPLRPRPSPDQTAADQQPAPGENREQGKVNPAEVSQPPQTNGDVAQQQRRQQPRRRRQRNSESSTSKVGGRCSGATRTSPRCSAQPAASVSAFSERCRKVCVGSRNPASDLQTERSQTHVQQLKVSQGVALA